MLTIDKAMMHCFQLDWPSHTNQLSPNSAKIGRSRKEAGPSRAEMVDVSRDMYQRFGTNAALDSLDFTRTSGRREFVSSADNKCFRLLRIGQW
jgi:hypothetical protein